MTHPRKGDRVRPFPISRLADWFFEPAVCRLSAFLLVLATLAIGLPVGGILAQWWLR